MNQTFFHTIFAVAFFAMVTLRIYYGRKARQERSGVENKESKRNMAIRAAFGLGYVGAVVVYIFAPGLFAWTDIQLPDWSRWIGALITIGSVLLLWWVQWALDVQFDTNLHTQAEHQLIKHGPYKRVRHPMYTFEIVFCLGYWLANLTWSNAIVWMLLVSVQVARAMREERAIEGYDEYVARVQWRFIPGVV